MGKTLLRIQPDIFFVNFPQNILMVLNRKEPNAGFSSHTDERRSILNEGIEFSGQPFCSRAFVLQ